MIKQRKEFNDVTEILKYTRNIVEERNAKSQDILRSNFWEYCKYIDSGFFRDDKPKLKEIADRLQDVFEGKNINLIINVTVRTGKSYILTMFITFMLGNNPTMPILRAAAIEDLYKTFSQDALAIIKSNKYHKVFPEAVLNPNDQSWRAWSLTLSTQKAFFGGGMDSSIIGHGAEMLIVDDPVKGRSQAFNDKLMDRLYEIYSADLKSRLDPNKLWRIIILHTRWNNRDLTGRLEYEQGLASLNGSVYDENGNKYSGKWHKYMYPALDENGKSFDESIYPTEKLLQTRQEMIDGGMEDLWNLMYQQDVKSVDKRQRLFLEESLNQFRKSHLDEIIKNEYSGHVNYSVIVDPADSGSNNLAFAFYVKLGGFYYIVDVIYTPIELGHKKTDDAVVYKFNKYHISKFEYEKDGMGNVFSKLLKEFVLRVLGRKIKSKGHGTKNINKHQRILIKSGDIKKKCYFLVKEERDKDYDKFMSDVTAYNREHPDKNRLDAPDLLAYLVDDSKSSRLVDSDIY